MIHRIRFIVLAAALTVFLFFMYDRYILPPALEVSRNLSLTYVNGCINDAVISAESELGREISSICSVSRGSDGAIKDITADGMAVNRFCALTAANLSSALNSSENAVYIKLGELTGIPLFSNLGPEIPIKIKCTGGAAADYDTEVKSVGINQVSFTLFININAQIDTYSPFVSNRINVSRKIMLANALYAGNVPQALGIGVPFSQ